LALAACLLTPAPARAQNAENGKAVFKQICSICHEVVADRNRIGPSLFAVVGRKSGQVPGYNYSDGNKGANMTWDEATLDKYLVNPRGVVPGTKMAYAGLKDDQKRHDLIAYLATLK
jgi:cytochrome c